MAKKKKLITQQIAQMKEEWIIVYTDESAHDCEFTLEQIIQLANKHKPEDYPELTYKDVSFYLDKDVDYGYYNDVYTSVILEIKIKNKDHVKKIMS